MDKHKIIVLLALFAPAVLGLMKTEVNPIWLVACAGFGAYIFNDKFIAKDDIPRPVVNLGPQKVLHENRGPWPPVNWEKDSEGRIIGGREK